MDRSFIWGIPSAVIAILALIVGLNALAATGGAGPGVGTSPQSLEVSLIDLDIVPAALSVEAGRPITLQVRNDGAVPHDLVVEGHGHTPMLSGGQAATLDLGVLPAGSYRLYCDVPGHAGAGMEATLTVGDGEGAHAMTWQEMDESYMRGVEAFPAETRGMGGQLMEPVIADGVKVFELTAAETEWEIAPGDVRKAMAYNGQVPGPEIRVGLGERVRVVLHNELNESTAIHFHGLDVPFRQDGVPGLTQDLVEPGDSYTYEFTVPNAGTHMYHSHMNGAHQIPMGLLGAFIVEGPDEPASDHDVVMVLNDGPHGYTINGKQFPATQPIVAAPGETVRVRYLNEGLQGHPMHLHGMAQTVIAKDGHPLPMPYKADTIWVSPGERYDVLITAREGLWAFHCHILSHAENETGMFGMVTVMIVQ